MGMEYKNVAVGGVTKVEDEGDGIVTAYVSLTGIKDNVNDIILPGAYKKTLKQRTPKGAWGHDWKTPTAKTLEIVELQPGHPDLPKALPNGEAWPSDAGALRVKMQFNLGSSRGRDAYSDVMFFKDDQEWSIGYSVPKDGFYKKDGVRYIKELDLFEYSPVLFGAMPHARTASVKDAQLALKQMNGATLEEVKGWEKQLIEFKAAFGYKDDEGTDPDVSEPEGDDEVDEDGFYEDEEGEGDDDEGKDVVTPELLRETIAACEKMLATIGESKDDGDAMIDAVIGQQAYIEAKATHMLNLGDTTVALKDAFTAADWDALQEAADDFDEAAVMEDLDGLEKSATDFLDLIEKGLKHADDEFVDDLHVAATVVADVLQDVDVDADGQATGKSYFVRSKEYKSFNFDRTARMFGTVQEKGRLARGTAPLRAFVRMLDDEPLMALKNYMDSLTYDAFDDEQIESLVTREIARRDLDEKMGDYAEGHPMEEAGKRKKPVRKRGRMRDKYEEEDDARRRGTGRIGAKGDFTEQQRTNAARRGNAMGDGSYPINNVEDLKNAIQACGRAKDKEKAKAHIMKRAKEMGKEDLLPDGWKIVTLDLSEFKDLGIDLPGM